MNHKTIKHAILAMLLCLAPALSQAKPVSLQVPEAFKAPCAGIESIINLAESDIQARFPGTTARYSVEVVDAESDGSTAEHAPDRTIIRMSAALCHTPSFLYSMKHELIHAYTRYSVGLERYRSMPRWFKEGLAVVWSGQLNREWTQQERDREARYLDQIPLSNERPENEGFLRAALLIESMNESAINRILKHG